MHFTEHAQNCRTIFERVTFYADFFFGFGLIASLATPLPIASFEMGAKSSGFSSETDISSALRVWFVLVFGISGRIACIPDTR